MKSRSMLAGTAATFAALLTVAAQANEPVPVAQPALPAAPPATTGAQDVAAFYVARQGAPLWFSGTSAKPAAIQLIAILKRAHLDGLAEGPALAARAEAAVQSVQSDASVAAADQLLSAAWVAYVKALKAPVRGVIYGDPARRPPVLHDAAILNEAAVASSLDDHLKNVSNVNPLFAQLRDATWAQVQAGIAPDSRVTSTLDRLRMLPAAGRFVMVDIASARLFMVEDGQIRDSMKVIVGKPAYFTPQITSTINFVTFNPYWHVPPDMVRRTVAPAVQRRGAAYLKRQNYELFIDGPELQPLSVSDVDWKSVAAGQPWKSVAADQPQPRPILVRQLPGAYNAMGKMKIFFDNDEGIYLHDTPQKHLFANARRALSGGCIRLEDAPRLVRWLLGSEPVAPSPQPELHVRLPQSVPIFVTYLTAHLEGPRLQLAEDIYGWDRPPASAIGLAGASQ